MSLTGNAEQEGRLVCVSMEHEILFVAVVCLRGSCRWYVLDVARRTLSNAMSF